MRIDGRAYRSIWPTAEGDAIDAIDQTLLPHQFATRRIDSLEAAAAAIETMVVRGAPLIGATAAFGLALALRRAADDFGARGGLSRAGGDPTDCGQLAPRA